MRIQVISPHFTPDIAATGRMMTGIVDGLAAAGHQIHVVTSLPFYRNNEIEEGWQGRRVRHDDTEWGRITRVHPFPAPKDSLPRRAVGFAGFTGLATGQAVIDRWRPDIVLAMSPPLTLGLAGWVAARRRRVPFVFNVQDIFPQVTVELGLLTNRSAIRFFTAMERFIYRRADAVTVLSDDMRATVVGGLGAEDADRVTVIPNFVDHDWITPADRHNSFRAELGLGDETVVMYAGNLGFSQPLESIVAAARALAGRTDVRFVVVGDGARRDELEQLAVEVDNLDLVGFVPTDRMPEVLAASDIQLVPLRRGLTRCSVPSKFYANLAAARPVVVSVDPGSELDRVLAEVPAGLAVAPDDDQAFIDAITRLVDDPAAARRMGETGRAWIEQWASPTSIGERYSDLFEELLADRSQGRPR
ncbi:MAG: glycosyltransferase family 4 protein [Acidimicrobiales bacterium]